MGYLALSDVCTIPLDNFLSRPQPNVTNQDIQKRKIFNFAANELARRQNWKFFFFECLAPVAERICH